MLGAIPQKGRCPNKCPECFFQSGRSYLEPLDENTPNMPGSEDMRPWTIVRVNDGNDSNYDRELVMASVLDYPFKFYNTSAPHITGFDAPVVLTVNPGALTDSNFYRVVPIPRSLMFVRVRVNTWNIEQVVDPAVKYYTAAGVPVVLTFMAYHDEGSIPEMERTLIVNHGNGVNYTLRTRTTNPYYAITTEAWRAVMRRYEDNKYVYSCGREGIETKCRFCGNCLREWFATMERLQGPRSDADPRDRGE